MTPAAQDLTDEQLLELLATATKSRDAADADVREINAELKSRSNLRAEEQLEVRRMERNRVLQSIARELRGTMQCNCDLDKWEPTIATGHSHVCRIHKAAFKQYYKEHANA